MKWIISRDNQKDLTIEADGYRVDPTGQLIFWKMTDVPTKPETVVMFAAGHWTKVERSG